MTRVHTGGLKEFGYAKPELENDKKYNICYKCKKIIKELPYNCRHCNKIFCSEHRLPEDHYCQVVKVFRQSGEQKWKKTIKDIFSRPQYHENYKELGYKKENFFKKNILKLKSWLKDSEHYPYDYKWRIRYRLPILIKFIFSILAFYLVYSNIQKLNEILIWIIRLGSVLLLTSLFFILKYGYEILKEIPNWFKRQERWLRYLIILILLFLLWQAYSNRDGVLNPVFNVYNKTNFTVFMPIKISNLNTENKEKVSFNYNNRSNNYKKENRNIEFPLKPDIDIFSLEKEIHELINEERKKAGLQTLSWDDNLSDIAREHSIDMALNNYFSHDNLDGQDPTDRANAKGYNCYKDYGDYYTEGIAENIFQNNLYNSVTYINFVPFHDWNTQSEIAQSTVEGWMESPGHRENILTASYDKEGIGLAISGGDKIYITENFC